MNDEFVEIEDEILELDDGSRYVLMDEFDFEGKRYYFTVGYLEDGYDPKLVAFFEHIVEGEDEYVEKVNDQKLYKKLLANEATISATNDDSINEQIINEIQKMLKDSKK